MPPKPDKKPPTVAIVEGNHFVTSRRSLVLHAEATDNRAVAAVEFFAGDGRWRPAVKDGGSWELRVLLGERLTYVRVRARDTSGNISKPFLAVIFRAGR